MFCLAVGSFTAAAAGVALKRYKSLHGERMRDGCSD